MSDKRNITYRIYIGFLDGKSHLEKHKIVKDLHVFILLRKLLLGGGGDRV